MLPPCPRVSIAKRDTFAGIIPSFQVQLIQILLKNLFITHYDHFANHAATICKALGLHHVTTQYPPRQPDAHLVMNEDNCRQLHLKVWLHNAYHNKLSNRS